MKMDNKTSPLNFGDTSFRRKKYMEEFKQILSLLRIHMNDFSSWERDSSSQKDFYQSVIYNTDIFDRNEVEDSKLAKRARTLTNSMVKVGLINNKRYVSEVGNAWLDDKLKENDLLENMLSISKDNLLFFRQWSKFRFFNYEGKRFFSPFLYALKFLSYYNDVPEEHFLLILHSIKPDSNDSFVENSIKMYQKVVNEELTFNLYYEKYIVDNNELVESLTDDTINMIISEKVSDGVFGKYFVNRKSQSNAVPDYKRFVEALMKYRNEQTLDSFHELRKSSKLETVKKAFGYNKIPFEFKSKANHDPIVEFNNVNINNNLLFGNKELIYYQFLDSKRFDLLREYSDLTKRLLNLSGIIEFENSIVNLTYKDLFNNIFDSHKIALVGDGNFSEYEGNLNSIFYKNCTFLDSVGIEESIIENSLVEVSTRLNLESINELPHYYKNERLLKINEIINQKFGIEETINILKLISERDDEKVNQIVTDSASVPTIFEYILSIALYHMSDKSFNILDSFNLSLDASLLPLSHATGYKGDIEIKDMDPALLIEATLMDTNNQKRNELEPVIRHTTNFTIEQKPKDSLGIFVANEVDDNVSNIFRACSRTELKHSRQDSVVSGINIYPFSIKEIIKMMESNLKLDSIVSILSSKVHKSDYISMGWKEEITEEIFR